MEQFVNSFKRKELLKSAGELPVTLKKTSGTLTAEICNLD